MVWRVSEKERIYLFHIRRADGRSLILHPFQGAGRIMAQMEECEIIGCYGAEPRVEALTAFRSELYQRVDAAVSAWRADARFIPRFLLSSVVFLAAYFGFSYVIRDPIPVVDDVIYALGTAFLVYTLLKRKDPTSEPAARKRKELTAIVDGVRFSESPFLLKVEEILHRYEGEELKDLAGRIAEPEGTAFDAEQKEEARQFLLLLEETLKLQTGKHGKRRRHAFRRTHETDKDPSLYAVYRGISKSVSTMDRRP